MLCLAVAVLFTLPVAAQSPSSLSASDVRDVRIDYPATSLNLAPTENPEVEHWLSLILSAKAAGETPNPDWYDRLADLMPTTSLAILDQGADACPATVIPAIPYTAQGSTAQYTDDYFGSCVGLGAPDVIYEYTPAITGQHTISLGGSDYDTGLYIRTGGACPGNAEVDCDDDDGPGLTSRIVLTLDAGVTYWIIVDGYAPHSGNYSLAVTGPCIVECQPNDIAECYESVGDPNHSTNDCNGGCNSDPDVFQTLLCGQTVCGQVFTYLGPTGAPSRDTDWYQFTTTGTYDVSWTVVAETPVDLYFVNITDCASPTVIASGSAPNPCVPATLTADDLPAGTYAAWVGTNTFSGVPTPKMYRGTLMWDECLTPPTGACCYDDPFNPLCADVTEAACTELGGTWYPDQTCATFDCPIPPPPPLCPENSLFAQPPTPPDGDWSFFTSDILYSYLVYDNFWEITEPICDIHWWGLTLEYDEGWYLCDAEDFMTFAITFYTTNPNGGPGDPACTYTVRVQRQPTGLLYAGYYPMYYWSTTLDPCCTLTSGWVSIQGVSGASPDCMFLWVNSPVGDDVSYQQVEDSIGLLNPLYTDLAFCLTPGGGEEEMDMGDIIHPLNAPFGYPTQVANPGHILSGVAWLGAGITGEPAPNVFELDPADDGVVFPPYMYPCTPTWVTVTVTAGPNFQEGQPLFLSAWKDGNNDGDFCDVLCPDATGAPTVPEWFLQDIPVYPGTWTFNFIDPGLENVPPYPGWFRFRLTSQPVGPFGFGSGAMSNWNCQGTFAVDYLGEVEDYWFDEYQLDVELASFDAIPGEGEVTLRWRTASELGNDFFEILRDGIAIETVPSQGDNAAGHNYSFTDETLESGVVYTYTLVAVDLTGAREVLGTASATPYATVAAVTEYALYQNYPNPFNPMTTIAFDLPSSGLTTLAIYNMMGQQITTLVNGNVEAGHHTVTFDASSLPSGTYWYRLTSGEFSAVKKMMLMK